MITEVEDKQFNTIMAELHHLDFTGEDEKPWTIHRVLHSIRNEHSADYDPKIISIGPLHAGKKTLEPIKSLKWIYLHDLLHRCRQDDRDTLEKYINKVRELEARARKRYAEVVVLDSDDFVQIMIPDACFIIEQLIRWNFRAKRRERHMRVHEIIWCQPLMRNDLLLLENQIPFFIVQSLFELSNILGLLDLEALAISYVTGGQSMSVPATVDPKKAHHLLHLFHLSFLPTSTIMTVSPCGDMVMSTIKEIESLASGSLFWILSSFLYGRLPLKCLECQQLLTDKDGSRTPRMIPSATELKESGVEFRRKEAAMSLLDVTFRDGVMEIPLLSIEDNTAPRHRNLIACEQCCPTSGSHFTSHAVLLDNLINTPEYVAVLKKYGIIESLLGRDEEVTNLFNALVKGAYLNLETHYLAQLFKDVNQYCEVDRHRWRARLVHDYFGTPLSAIFLLFLTVVQTIYAVLAYHKPPK